MWVNYYFMIVSAVILVVSIVLMVFSSYVETRTKKGLIDASSRMARVNNNENYQNFLYFLFIVGLFVLIATGVLTLIVEVGVKSDILLWVEKKDMMQRVVEAGGDLDNISITQTKIEFNNWLASAKVELERWGTWSTWWPYKEIIESLEYWI